MKKIISVSICCIILMLSIFSFTAFAWETPELTLDVSFNEKKNEVTVEYRVNNFAGTESADFILEYNPDIVKMTDYETTKIDDTFVEINDIPDEGEIKIQFIDLYCVQYDDCDDDGSAVVTKFTFSIIDTSAKETVFISKADSCAVDPNSTEISLDRFTTKVMLTSSENENTSNESNSSSVFSNPNVKKVVIVAVITFIVLIASTTAIVIKYRKTESE